VSTNGRYDILFQPLRIGPVTARNRFYQVPHCNGMGHRNPSGMAAMRGIKAEGGWSVVFTEVCEIHPSGDVAPHIEARLWDDDDIPALATMCDAVHAHGALAGVELAHHGLRAFNRYSREVSIGPTAQVIGIYEPTSARAMTRRDITDFRRWHRAAALRAKAAGFDIVAVYASHGLTLPYQFLSRRFNKRTDEYGGSLENRVRLLREVIEDTRDAIGDKCAVVVRFGVEELLGAGGVEADGEGREVVERLAELPDLWDVNLSGWDNDSVPSRFAKENFQGSYVEFVKRVTSKPVVGVGRFTSPDLMAQLIRSGRLDMIGAARPSIADPFLPQKIAEGRVEDIRECIGCNICVTGDFTSTPIRCTQNPTMGEEWRKGWHPERIPLRKTVQKILVVGGGPSGLECAMSLARRQYEVTLAEASGELGGRVTSESRLPGLAEWARVRDYRVSQLQRAPSVEIFTHNALSAEEILGLGLPHVVLATGARWRRDGIGRGQYEPVPVADGARVYTPDDLYRGTLPQGPVVVFDSDHYYLGGVLCEHLRNAGLEVTLVTPAPVVSQWCVNTMEQERIQSRLLNIGVRLVLSHRLDAVHKASAAISCTYTGRGQALPAASVLLVTARAPDDSLYGQLMSREAEIPAAGLVSVTRIGDCLAPGTIAAAVYAGHRFAREFETPSDEGVPFLVERCARG
jgi:dimethylamine/trimethylamine dehydrogenase